VSALEKDIFWVWSGWVGVRLSVRCWYDESGLKERMVSTCTDVPAKMCLVGVRKRRSGGTIAFMAE